MIVVNVRTVETNSYCLFDETKKNDSPVFLKDFNLFSYSKLLQYDY